MMAKSNKTADSGVPQVSFEQALDELKSIVRDMESGQLTLEQSLVKYEQGVAHLSNCDAVLRAAEQRIRLLVDVDAEGNARTRGFDHEASVEAVRPPERPRDRKRASPPDDPELF